MYKLRCKLLQYILAGSGTRLLIRYCAKTMEMEYWIYRLETAPNTQLCVLFSARANMYKGATCTVIRFLQIMHCLRHIKCNQKWHFFYKNKIFSKKRVSQFEQFEVGILTK